MRTTQRPTRTRLMAAIALLAMTLAACGLKQETRDQIGFSAGASAEFADPGSFGGDAANPLAGGDSANPLLDSGGGDDALAAGGGTTGAGLGSTSGTTGGTATGTTGGSTSSGTTPAAGGASGAGTGGSTGGGSAGGSTGGSTGGGSTGGGSTGGGTTPPPPAPSGGAGGGDAAAPPPPAPAAPSGASVTGSDRTGVDAAGGSINIAIHAPVTGAAPLPVTSFEEARDLYFRYRIAQDGDIGGFTNINVSFADDRYQPSTAVQACRQLAESNFLLLGAGGTDQIQACGRFAESQNIPYFSAGVTEAGLAGLRNYFAFSMSYRQQGLLLAQRVASAYPGQKVAAIVTGTQNFDDAVAGWEAGVDQAGLRGNYYKTLRHPKGDTSWINTYANELSQNGVDVVFMLTAPLDYIRFAQQANQQGYSPQFVGVGVSMGLNAVLGSGCPDVDGGEWFSPFPGLDWAQSNEPEFFQAAQQFGTPSDDIALSLWGTAKFFEQLLVKYRETYGSNDVTREDFRNLVEVSSIDTGVFPAVQFSANNHFGANQVHLIKANCATGQHETLATFSAGF